MPKSNGPGRSVASYHAQVAGLARVAKPGYSGREATEAARRAQREREGEVGLRLRMARMRFAKAKKAQARK